MNIHQELSMIFCPNLKLLDLSHQPILSSKNQAVLYHVQDIFSGLPASVLSSLEELRLENVLIHQYLPSSQNPTLKDILGRFQNLKRLSFAGGAFAAGTARHIKENMLKFCIENIPNLDEVDLENTHISKDQGVVLSRAVKAKAKKGFTMRIRTKGSTGLGIRKMMTLISLSKFVFSEFSEDSGILTIQRV